MERTTARSWSPARPTHLACRQYRYQETAARRWPALIGTLSDLGFVQAKWSRVSVSGS